MFIIYTDGLIVFRNCAEEEYYESSEETGFDNEDYLSERSRFTLQ